MGGTADAQSADKVENPRFKIFASQKCSGKGRNTIGEVYPAVPSLFNCGNTISIADWFGRTMADSMPDVTIGIIPVAVGGASIKLFDQDQYASYLSTAEDWLKNYAKEYASDGNVTKTIIDIAKREEDPRRYPQGARHEFRYGAVRGGRAPAFGLLLFRPRVETPEHDG